MTSHTTREEFDPTDDVQREDWQRTQMRNAQYWAAQTQFVMERTNYGGPDGRWYVQILGGTVSVVFDSDFWNISQIKDVFCELRDRNIPLRDSELRDLEETPEDCEKNPTLVVESDDTQLTSGDPDWQAWESMPGFGWERRPDGTIYYPEDDSDP